MVVFGYMIMGSYLPWLLGQVQGLYMLEHLCLNESRMATTEPSLAEQRHSPGIFRASSKNLARTNGVAWEDPAGGTRR